MARWPYPYIARVLPDGTVQPHKTDFERCNECVRDFLCQICGERLPEVGYGVTLYGLEDAGAGFNGGALMHGGCLRESFRLCGGNPGIREWLMNGNLVVVASSRRYSLKDPTAAALQIDANSAGLSTVIARGDRPPSRVSLDQWLTELGVT